MELTKSKKILFMISIILCNAAIMGESVAGVVFNNLYELFPEHIGVVNTIISIPMLTIMIGSLIAGGLMRKFSKKTIMLMGAVLFGVFGFCGAMIENVYYILAMRIFYGFGIAFINVSSVAFIAEMFEDENERATMMGFNNAGLAAMGVVMSLLASVLVVGGWKHVYFAYAVAIIMVVMILFFLPNIKPQKDVANEVVNKGKKDSFGLKFWVFLIAFTLFNMVYCTFIFYISTYIAENALGTASMAGYVNAAYTAGGFIFSLFFGKLYSKIKKVFPIVMYAIGAVCCVGLWQFPVASIFIVIGFIFGGAYNLLFTYAYAYCPTIIPESRIDDAMSMITCLYGLGCFAATYFATCMMGFFGGFAITPVYSVSALVAVVCIVIGIFVMKLKSPSEK